MMGDILSNLSRLPSNSINFRLHFIASLAGKLEKERVIKLYPGVHLFMIRYYGMQCHRIPF